MIDFRLNRDEENTKNDLLDNLYEEYINHQIPHNHNLGHNHKDIYVV